MSTLEGILLKDAGWRKGWRKRYFKLSKVYFQYYENEACTSPKAAIVRGTIQNVELVDLQKCHFKVMFKSETWDLQASNKQELIKWMETIKPKSADFLWKQSTLTEPVRLNSVPRDTVTSFVPVGEEHEYQPLPQNMGGSPRLIPAHVVTDGRTSPSTSLHPSRSSGSLDNPVSDPLTNTYTSPDELRTGSGTSQLAIRINSSSTKVEESDTNPPLPTPSNPTLPSPLNLSDDEFLDFDDNDLVEVFSTDTPVKARVGRRTVSENTPSSTMPHVRIVLDSPDQEKTTYMNTGTDFLETPEYINDDNEIDSDPSPTTNRGNIKSNKHTGNINYSLSTDLVPSDDDGDSSPRLRKIKSQGPATIDHTLKSPGYILHPPRSVSPNNGITTLRIQEWMKNVTPVKKEFVDPGELDELDKYLVENTKCLPKENISLLSKIGNGAFGEVWKGRYDPAINGHTLVAVKILKEGSAERHRNDFYGEAALLGQFQHPNVIALHGVILKEQSPWIVIEFAENGALKSFLKTHGESRHSNQLLSYCRDIVRGMKYLSERGFIHRDLAARNVLVSRLEECKIADFGLSRKLGDDDDIYVSRGGMVAIKWTAPEGVLGASYSSASDVWSCGVTMWEVFSIGANPFSGQSNEDAFRYIRRGGRLAQAEKCPHEIHSVMLKCWEANPCDRPSFGQLDTMLYNPNTEVSDDPALYENTDGFMQYMNMEYENMPDVERQL